MQHSTTTNRTNLFETFWEQRNYSFGSGKSFLFFDRTIGLLGIVSTEELGLYLDPAVALSTASGSCIILTLNVEDCPETERSIIKRVYFA